MSSNPRVFYARKKSHRALSPKSRIPLLFGAFAFISSLLLVRLFTLQIVDHRSYAALASGQQKMYRELFPERGNIFVKDRVDGKLYPLATNKDVFLMYAEPRLIEDPKGTADKLTAFFNVEPEAFFDKLNRPDDPYEPLRGGVSEEEAARLHELKIEGLKFARQSVRYYPENDFGHITGFVGFENDGNRRGKYGLESFYEEELAGRRGFFSGARDAAGRIIGTAARFGATAEDGKDLLLTIDRTVQFFVCARLREAVARHGAVAGSVIVVNPENGAIIAMCAMPQYDPNAYSKVSDIAIFNNPTIFYEYEPGSVMKPITLAAAIDAEAVSPETVYEDKGFVEIGKHIIRNSDKKAHGTQTMLNVLEKSLNTGAVFAAKKLGSERLRAYFEAFGFGAVAGIDLDTEVPGNISTLKKSGEIWGATASYGQGITVTPLQLVMAYAALGNGGKLMRPYIVEEIRTPDGKINKTEPRVIRQVIAPRTSLLISAMLTSVVLNGHGKRAGVSGYEVAGKTGTAQIPKKDGAGYEESATIGTFVGFAPVSQPRFAVIARIDRPNDVEFAESTAAPLFGEIMKFLLHYYGVAPER